MCIRDRATTNELSELLGVSTTTIRTDLNQMDKEKLLTKTHGGAISVSYTHLMSSALFSSAASGFIIREYATPSSHFATSLS